jgi:hypothetical protein
VAEAEKSLTVRGAEAWTSGEKKTGFAALFHPDVAMIPRFLSSYSDIFCPVLPSVFPLLPESYMSELKREDKPPSSGGFPV